MPKLPQPLLEVAWRHTGETGKIHYRVRRPDGSTRHLITREGEALYEVLQQHLDTIGYTGPQSATEGSEEH
jgi:hypothetical protein